MANPLSAWCSRQNSAAFRLEWTLLYTVVLLPSGGCFLGLQFTSNAVCCICRKRQQSAYCASCARLPNGARVLHLVSHCCQWCHTASGVSGALVRSIWTPFALPLWCLWWYSVLPSGPPVSSPHLLIRITAHDASLPQDWSITPRARSYDFGHRWWSTSTKELLLVSLLVQSILRLPYAASISCPPHQHQVMMVRGSSCQRLVTIMIPLSTFSVCTAPHHTPPSNHLHSPSPPPPSGVCTQCGTHPSPICRCYPCTCHNICHQDISASSDIKDHISHNHMVKNPRCLPLSM